MLIPNLRVVLGLALGLAGCGVISADVTNFDLSLPDKNFTINIDGWKVDQSKADAYLMTSCANASPVACNSAVAMACTMNCSGSCNATSHTCDLSLDVSLAQAVDLVMDKPELKSINDQPVIKVSIDSVTYEVKANSLTVATPEITIYVAPISVTSVKAGDPSIKPIGTIDPVAAGTTTTAPQPIKFTASGKAELVNIMSSFKTPFNVLVGSSIVVTAGQPIPMGKLDAVIHITGHAGL
jgi:hypothetical protein